MSDEQKEATILITSGAYSDYQIDCIVRGPVQSFRGAFEDFIETPDGAHWKGRANPRHHAAEERWAHGPRACAVDRADFDKAFTRWLVTCRGFREVGYDEWHMGYYAEKPWDLRDEEEKP